MSEKINVEHAFDPEARQAQADFDAYMNSRPYKDERGNTHDPENGAFVNAEKFFNEQRDAFEQESTPEAYEDMSMPQLAKKLASAEFEGDKTKAEDISDALMEKLSAEEERIASEKDGEHNESRSENLWNRVMGIKDKELARLSGDNEKSPKSKKDSADIEDDVFTYDSQEEFENKDAVIAEKAAESEPVADSEVFDDAENEATSPEKKKKESVADIVDRIAQRRYDADGWDEEAEKADFAKIERIVDYNINKQLDEEGVNDPEERQQRFNKIKKTANRTVLGLIDKANEKLRNGKDVHSDDVIETPEDATAVVSLVESVDDTKKEGWFKRNKRKAAGALLALAGIGGAVFLATGSQHEDKGLDIDLGNHGKNVEAVVDIDEFDNKLGEKGVSTEVRAEIAQNFDQAQAFFEQISTKEGLDNFKVFTEQFEKSVQDNMKTYGMDRASAEALTRAEVQQYFAHFEAAKLKK